MDGTPFIEVALNTASHNAPICLELWSLALSNLYSWLRLNL